MSAHTDAHLNEQALGGPESQVDAFIAEFNKAREVSLKQNTYTVEYCDGNERVQIYTDAYTVGGALWDVMERYGLWDASELDIKVRKI